MEEGTETVVALFELGHGECVADNGKLRAVDAVGVAVVGDGVEDLPGENLQHTVSEAVTVHLVYLGELGDADEHDADVGVAPDADVEVLEEPVLVPEPGQRVDVTLHSVVAYGAGKVVGLAEGVAYHETATGAHVVLASDPLCPVLHVVGAGVSLEYRVDGLVVGVPVLGVDAVLPDVSRAIHVFRG